MAKHKDIGIREYRLASGDVRWRIEFRDHNGDRRRVSEFTTKSDAKDARGLYKAAVSRAKKGIANDADRALLETLTGRSEKAKTEGTTWYDFTTDTFLPDYRGRWGQIPVSTYYTEATSPTVEPFKTFGNMPIKDTTRERIEWYVRGEQKAGVSAATIRKRLTLMHTIAGFAVERGIIQANPIAGIKKPPAPEPAARALTVEQWEAIHARLKDAFNPDRSMAEFALLTCARLGEARRLQWTDVNLKAGYVTLRHSKGGRERCRKVKLTDEAVAVLPDVQDAGYVFVDTEGKDYTARWRGVSCSQRFRKAAKAAGQAWATFKTLRTTAATWAEEGDVSVEATQKALGHADVRTTQAHYRRSEADKTAPVVAAVARAFRSKMATKTETTLAGSA